MSEVLRAHDHVDEYGTTWRTLDELNFLDRLGEHHNTVGYSPQLGRALRASDRIRLLRSYLTSMKHRHYWRNLDQEAIRRHAEKLIDSYTALCKTKGS